jgi:glycosyltransferase involved in cell wall biosynthesis
MRIAANHAIASSSDQSPDEETCPGSVLVFTAELLPYSETFVRDHVASLTRRNAILVGAKSVPGLSTEGLKTALLPNTRSARLLLWLMGISPELDRLVQIHGIRLIHAHFADAGARLARYASRRRLPLIVTLHGADVLRRSRGTAGDFINRLLWPGLMRAADLFLPVSDHLARKAAERGFPSAKLRRHYLGIPLFPVAERSEKNVAPPTILFIGRLVEKKGLPYLLEACRILVRRGLDFHLKIIGDGPLLEQCRADAAPLHERVTFLGRLAPERVRDELAAAQIACMPSIEATDGDNEGLPIVSLEAQAAGLPIVAFDQGPVPECVHANSTGLLAKDRSAEDLASCLERLLRNPELCRRMGDAGRRHVEEHFDIKRQSKELEKIYNEVLARHVGSGADTVTLDKART